MSSASTRGGAVFVLNCTDPSHISALAPPVWKAYKPYGLEQLTAQGRGTHGAGGEGGDTTAVPSDAEA